MRVSVIGLGYVGLVTAACLAEWGHRVTGVEAKPERLAKLRRGQLPFHEPGLDDLVRRLRPTGRLRFASADKPAYAVRSADVVITAVGTHDGNGGWQTATMLDCLTSIVPHMRSDAVLVCRSTLPPELIARLRGFVGALREKAGKPMIPVLLNPEFTREGAAVHDFMDPERIVFGIVHDPQETGVEIVKSLYDRASAPMLVQSAIDAAFAKLGANLFLATKISFANELAQLCEAYGANVQNVVAAMAYDGRIGGRFLSAGIGFGGSCLPNQVAMTARAAQAMNLPADLFDAVYQVNRRQRQIFVEKLERLVEGPLRGKRVGLLGLTFKPGTDDLRDAPSLAIAAALLAEGATVVAYDPMPTARALAVATLPGLIIADSAEEALTGADAAGLVTEWPEFTAFDWAHAARLMRTPVLVDGRNALDPEQLAGAGFRYDSFGRPQAGQVTAMPLEAVDNVVASPLFVLDPALDGAAASVDGMQPAPQERQPA